MECYPKLRERGQVTIPEEVRDALGLQKGDQLRLNVERIRSHESERVEADTSGRHDGKEIGAVGTNDDRWVELWPGFECPVCQSTHPRISVEPADSAEGELTPCCDRCGAPLSNDLIEKYDPERDQ